MDGSHDLPDTWRSVGTTARTHHHSSASPRALSGPEASRAMSIRALARGRGRSQGAVTVEAAVPQRDARGRVFEPFDLERLHGQQHVHGVVTKPDCLRVCSFFSTTHMRSRGLSRFA